MKFYLCVEHQQVITISLVMGFLLLDNHSYYSCDFLKTETQVDAPIGI